MTRRCKAGQRARIIGGGWNRGKVVLIIRRYFGEDMNGHWPLPLFPWVVTSLGGPLRNRNLTTNIENMPLMTIVVDDCDLEPLDDDDDGLDESTDTAKPADRENKLVGGLDIGMLTKTKCFKLSNPSLCLSARSQVVSAMTDEQKCIESDIPR